jgi:hypothetical protein
MVGIWIGFVMGVGRNIVLVIGSIPLYFLEVANIILVADLLMHITILGFLLSFIELTYRFVFAACLNLLHVVVYMDVSALILGGSLLVF